MRPLARAPFALFVSLALVGCARHTPVIVGPPAASVQRFPVETGDVAGLSDLTITDHGWYIAVPERRRVLVPISIVNGVPRVSGPMVPLEGVPDGLDTEAIAWLGDTHYAIGTESMQSNRDHDDVLFVDVEDDGRARVKRRLPLRYTAWDSYRASRNRGIEALCAARGALYAAAEETIDEGGARYAPIARLDPSGAMIAWRLRLTSDKGRVSAMTCRAREDGAIEAIAVERHFGISRLLRFTLPSGPSAQPIVPTVAADLAKSISPLPNIEGVAPAPGSDLARLLLITDNDYGGVTGPTEIIRVDLPPNH